MLLESWGLGSCMYSFPGQNIQRSYTWNKQRKKEVAEMGIWQKSDGVLGKAQI